MALPARGDDGWRYDTAHPQRLRRVHLQKSDKAFRNWGIPDLGKLINKAHFFYKKAAAEVEQDMSDEDFMALYEKYPEFDDFDDAFVENEEEWTSKVAYYIDENIQQFATIIK